MESLSSWINHTVNGIHEYKRWTEKKQQRKKEKKIQNQPFEAVECEMCEHMNTLWCCILKAKLYLRKPWIQKHVCCAKHNNMYVNCILNTRALWKCVFRIECCP